MIFFDCFSKIVANSIVFQVFSAMRRFMESQLRLYFRNLLPNVSLLIERMITKENPFSAPSPLP
jgi:hypothetical protein